VELIPLEGGREYAVLQEWFDELERLYPAVDATQTFREIRAWCLANPSRRKTARGVRRFINQWFASEQRRAENETP
jgi:hypothetical protein